VAYAVLGHAYGVLGKAKDARREYEACIAAIPTSAICMQGLVVQVAMSEGQCKEVETLSRKMLSISPDWFDSYLLLADALAGRPDSLVAVQESVAQWAKAIEERADTNYKAAAFLPARRLENQAHLDILAGDFISAEKNARESVHLRSGSSMLADHSVSTLELSLILMESGQRLQAGELAHDYLIRSAAWEPPGKGIDFVRPLMLELARIGQKLTLKAFTEQRETWEHDALNIARTKATGRNSIWYVAYANHANDAASAHEAIERLAFYQPVAWPGAWTSDLASAGHAYLLDGNVDMAIPLLEQATHHCRTFSDPIFHVQSHLWLGQALESKGDKSGACAAYKVVLDHWGHAKPKSITADEARSHARTLGCAM
jgi:serine/threonine-protein kinase